MWGAGVDADDAEFAAQQDRNAEEDMAIDEKDQAEERESKEMLVQDSADNVVGGHDPWSDSDPWASQGSQQQQ
eukprot:11633424-Karenia_brevis.AAC.1